MIVAGSLRVPGDKSISHRALILAALARGPSRVTGILESADVHSTASVLRALGVHVPALSNDFVVAGAGAESMHEAAAELDAGNSGTTTRLMAGVVAALPFASTFVGDASLSRRPMRRIARPLEAMGARFELPPHGGLPMTVHGAGAALRGVAWQSEAASAQVKSAILLAALIGGAEASVTEPVRSRDHTERMLRARGVAVRVNGTKVELPAGAAITPLDTAVPGDPSSAAFFAGLAALADGGSLRLEGVCVNETRDGFFRQLRRMGASVVEADRRDEGGEAVADLVISPAPLTATQIVERDVPAMVDELPLLACIATRAAGETRIAGAGELRVKESDRIAAVVANLRAIGAEAHELEDGMVIAGSDKPLRGRVETHGDHRLAMAFAVLGAARGNAIEIDDPGCVAVSYPEFWRDFRRAHS